MRIIRCRLRDYNMITEESVEQYVELKKEIDKKIVIKKEKELAIKAMQESKQLEQEIIDYERLKEKFGDLQ